MGSVMVGFQKQYTGRLDTCFLPNQLIHLSEKRNGFVMETVSYQLPILDSIIWSTAAIH